MKIATLLERLQYTVLQGDIEGEVSGICHDNRRIARGDAFICIAGARFDTHDVVSAIAASGAALIIVEKEVDLPEGVNVVLVESTRKVSGLIAAAWYGYPSEKLTTVGITGSKGKTTVTHMMADILRTAGFLTGTIGTNGAILPEREYDRSDAKTEATPCMENSGYEVYELNNSTPDAMEVQMYLAMMVSAGCTHAVIEVSSQGMKQHRVAGIEFDYGIWTNIETGDHIGPNEHADFEEYLYCKAMMLEQSKQAFVNCDDSHYEALLARMSQPVETYGQADSADYQAYDLQKWFHEETKEPGIAFNVKGKTDASVSVNLPGDFNMYNALAAVCVADAMGISAQCYNQALTHLKIKGRFDIVYRSDRFSVCVDFAHNGYSTRNHLEALREYHPKRLVCVFGADGNRSKYRRYEMGEASVRLADLSIITAGHNRYERFEEIFKDIEIGMDRVRAERSEPLSYLVIPKRQEAIRYAIEHAQEGDMITIIGLGHETYQEENGVKYPHSDTEFVRSVCRELGLL